MSRIRSKNTSIDLKMKEMISENGWSFEMYPKMLGNPDFVNARKKIVIFCDGDFWHGYKYEKMRLSKKFWRDKIQNNIRRDIRNTRRLRYRGWSVIRCWEHDIKKRPDVCIRKIQRSFRKRRIQPNKNSNM